MMKGAMTSMMLLISATGAIGTPIVAIVLPDRTPLGTSPRRIEAARVATIGLDKTGTMGAHERSRDPQTSFREEVASHGSLEAERGGFEPPVRFDPHTAFPVPHNRPLCHLS
jgi:hypothetical protein